MSGDNETQPNFDELFDKLLNTEEDIDTLITTIPSLEDFTTALDKYVTDKYSEDGLSDQQSQKLGIFLSKLNGEVEPVKLDDLDNLHVLHEEFDELHDSDELATVGSVLFEVNDDDSIVSKEKSKAPAEINDFTSSNIPSRPSPVNIELTPEIISIIKEEIEKTLGKAKELIASRNQEIPEELTKISSIQHDDDPKKSLATLATFLSTQQIPELRQLGNSLSEKWFYILPPYTEKFGSSPEAHGIDLVQNGYHQLLHAGNQLLIELYSAKNIEEFIEKCKKMPLYQELLVNNSDYQNIYQQRNKGKIPKVSDPPKDEQQNLLTAVHCVMWSINHISNLQGVTMERGSFKIIDPDNRLYDMLTSYTKLVNNGKLPGQTSFMRNSLSYVRQNEGIIGKHLSTHDPMCETLHRLYGIDSRPESDTTLLPLLPEGRQHSIIGKSDIEGKYPTTTVKWETAGINIGDALDHLGNLREMQKLQKQGELGKATTSGRSYRETQFTPKINEVFIKFLQKAKTKEPFVAIFDLSKEIENLKLLTRVNLRTKEDIEKKLIELNKKLEKEFKKLSIHQIYDFMDTQIESSPSELKQELINIKEELQKVADENQLDHQKIRAGSELILDFSKFCLLKNDLQDLLTINQNPLLTITETIGSSKGSTEQLSELYATLSEELSSTSIQETNSNHLKEILRQIFILENPDKPTLASETPHLYIAAQLRKINTNIAEKLLKKFPTISPYNATTPLLLAINFGNNNVVQALLENSTICDELINEKCNEEFTPLEKALDKGHTYIIATLLQHGAKIGDINSYNNIQKKHLLSELHKAERSQDKSIMEKIIEKNPTIKNIITQLEKDQQESLKTSVESKSSPSESQSSPRRSLLSNIAQSFSFKPTSIDPQSPSSSSRKQRTRVNQDSSPTPTTGNQVDWTDIDSIRMDSGSVKSPSSTSHNSGLPDSNQPLGSDSPATSPKPSRLARFARFANVLNRTDSSSPQAASSPKSQRSTNYVKKFDGIDEMLKSDSGDEQPSRKTDPHKKHI